VWVVGKGAHRQDGGLHFLWRNNLCVIIYILIVCRGSVFPRIRGLCVCVCVCVCVCARASMHARVCVCVCRRGKDVDLQTLQRQTGLQLWDPLISGTSGTHTHTHTHTVNQRSPSSSSSNSYHIITQTQMHSWLVLSACLHGQTE